MISFYGFGSFGGLWHRKLRFNGTGFVSDFTRFPANFCMRQTVKIKFEFGRVGNDFQRMPYFLLIHANYDIFPWKTSKPRFAKDKSERENNRREIIHFFLTFFLTLKNL